MFCLIFFHFVSSVVNIRYPLFDNTLYTLCLSICYILCYLVSFTCLFDGSSNRSLLCSVLNYRGGVQDWFGEEFKVMWVDEGYGKDLEGDMRDELDDDTGEEEEEEEEGETEE